MPTEGTGVRRPRPVPRAAGGALALALAACAANEPDRLTLTPVPYASLAGWRAEHPAEVLPDVLRACARFAAMPPDTPLGGAGEAARLSATPADWAPACDAARTVRRGRDAAARAWFETWLQPYRVTNNYRPDPLFTGYYEPELAGDRRPGPSFATPLLAPPPDLVAATLPPVRPGMPPRRVMGRQDGARLRPYWDRMAIEDGALDRHRLARLWLASDVDLFFLQIQGSGRVRLPSGETVRVGYAAQNGRPFVDIGRLLFARGEIDDLSMLSVRAWLLDHPAESRAVMDANPSYVFFREETALRPEQGPLGAFGLPLPPRRAAAVDPRFIPLGAPLWIDTTDPADGSTLRRLMLALDTGGAIRGPARADLFFGWGPAAETHASGMYGRGAAYVLLPRQAVTEMEVASADLPAPRTRRALAPAQPARTTMSTR